MNDYQKSALLKADMVLSDYVLSTDQDEKKIIFDLLDQYVSQLDDPAITLYFSKIAGATNESEKEIYIEILTDLFRNKLEK
ncbi:MAG: hypothetical protein KBT48_01805 [Firmicutes bacterium]|nr:hypothetical protein [Bacillota bacterium]